MQGDSIVVEPHHVEAAAGIAGFVRPKLDGQLRKYTISIAGESGSGKSETASALAAALTETGETCLILQQDDYFVHPPRTNDATRRADIGWVGPGEVRLDLLDAHLEAFRSGAATIEKPLVLYEEDTITSESLEIAAATIAIAEGTYTTALEHVDTRVFIDRDYLETRAHRNKRARDPSELDPFIDRVLAIEHEIISGQKARAHLIVGKDYSVHVADGV